MCPALLIGVSTRLYLHLQLFHAVEVDYFSDREWQDRVMKEFLM